MFSVTEPVHEHITMSESEKNLINSPLFQRLQWIGQLTGTRHIYPGGVHTRFVHSTGAMHVAGEYMNHLFLKFEGNVESIFGKSQKYFTQVARISALLHDIAHGPFSHSFDRTVYKPIYNISDNGHDLHRFDLIKSDLLKTYIEKCGILVDDIEKVWKSTRDLLKDPKKAMYHIIHCVIQGPLGADRLDFTKRDAYFTGSKQFGTIADKRIIYQSSIEKIDGIWCLCYQKSCISNIIQALDGRKYMYNNVYFHSISMASSLLIEKMMESCVKDLDLLRRVKDPNEFQKINDITLMGEIMNLPDEHIAKILCKKFMNRDLPKKVKEILYVPLDSSLPEDTDLPNNSILMETKMVSGIEAEKFEKWAILFKDRDDHVFSASKLLNDINYFPQIPYKIMRWYVL